MFLLTASLTLEDHKKISEIMAQACIESVVKERYGSKPFRVFRLLMMKKLLEQKQISEMALIPQKEAKEMLYSLLAENFVSVQVGLLGKVVGQIHILFPESHAGDSQNS